MRGYFGKAVNRDGSNKTDRVLSPLVATTIEDYIVFINVLSKAGGFISFVERDNLSVITPPQWTKRYFAKKTIFQIM